MLTIQQCYSLIQEVNILIGQGTPQDIAPKYVCVALGHTSLTLLAALIALNETIDRLLVEEFHNQITEWIDALAKKKKIKDQQLFVAARI